MDLDKIFNPKTIAVVGASDEAGGVGFALFNNLHSAYKGNIYPINIKRDTVQGVKAYPSIKEVPEKIDLAVIATPAKTVPAIVEECGLYGVKGIVIISSGFSEAGKEGETMAKNILDTAHKYKMRIIGPNCLGFIKPSINLNASFAGKMALPGNIAFISQSGALCTAILDWSIRSKVGFSNFISIGSMIDVGFDDLVEYLNEDKNTSTIIIYMESLNDANKFLKAAWKFSKTKQIFVLKSGRSSAGAKAAKSHTGSMTGDDEIFNAAFASAGIIRLESIDDLFYCAKALAMQPIPANNRIAVITNAGGPGVIATDAIIKNNGQLAELSKSTIDELNKFLPETWSHGNPVDILGDADAIRFKKALEVCIKDKNIDAALVVLTPQSMTNPTLVAKELAEISHVNKKTIYASWMGSGDVGEGRKILELAGIPAYNTPEDAIRAFTYIAKSSKSNVGNGIKCEFVEFVPKIDKNKKLLDKVKSENRQALTEAEAKEFLANYGLPVSKNAIIKDAKVAGEMAGKIGFPLVMKILSPDIIHKTDVSGVIQNVRSKEEAIKAFTKIMNSVRKNSPKAKIDGVFMEKMVNKKFELLLGCKKDDIFGPTIVFGMGGTAVEVYKDINVCLPPVDMSLALKLIDGTKISKLLKGYRGLPGVDMCDLQSIIYKFSKLITDFPEIKELDINPLAMDEKGGAVLDAKVII